MHIFKRKKPKVKETPKSSRQTYWEKGYKAACREMAEQMRKELGLEDKKGNAA